MGTKESTVAFLIDQLSALRGVRARKMFGEYALYYGEKVVALICDDNIFVKKTTPGLELIAGKYEDEPPYPGAKPAMLLDPSVFEDRELFCELVRLTASALPEPGTKKR